MHEYLKIALVTLVTIAIVTRVAAVRDVVFGS